MHVHADNLQVLLGRLCCIFLVSTVGPGLLSTSPEQRIRFEGTCCFGGWRTATTTSLELFEDVKAGCLLDIIDNR